MNAIKHKIKHIVDFLPPFKGSGGNLYIVIIMLFIMLGSALLSGFFTPEFDQVPSDERYIPDLSKASTDRYANLQLKTFPFKKLACGEKAAVTFLIDASGSMRHGTKMDNLKSGLLTFADKFPANGVVAMQSYSINPVELVPFSLFKDSKDEFRREVANLQHDTYTYSRDAFTFSKDKLAEGKRKFPDHNHVLIFISDGIPEIEAINRACPGGENGRFCASTVDLPISLPIQLPCRCFAQDQDPTIVAEEIKKQGVRIFTIKYIDSEKDGKLDKILSAMMSRVASSPQDSYEAPFDNQIAGIIDKITTRICEG